MNHTLCTLACYNEAYADCFNDVLTNMSLIPVFISVAVIFMVGTGMSAVGTTLYFMHLVMALAPTDGETHSRTDSHTDAADSHADAPDSVTTDSDSDSDPDTEPDTDPDTDASTDPVASESTDPDTDEDEAAAEAADEAADATAATDPAAEDIEFKEYQRIQKSVDEY
jgi:hypothetical protein